MNQADFVAALPLVVLVAGAALILLLDLIGELPARVFTWLGALVALGAGGAAALVGSGEGGFSGMLAQDGVSASLTLLIGLAAAGPLALSPRYLDREKLPAAEFVALVLFSAAGAVLMASGRDFVVIFLGLELLSLPLYVLTAMIGRATHSDEGALKYFLLGAAASAVLLYGIALIYATTGSLRLEAMGVVGATPMLYAGIALFLGGLAFKAALVPFHAWAPDAYESAPTPLTAFMAVAAKAGAFGALLRLAGVAGGTLDWRSSIAVLAAASIVLGNLAAIGQRRVKRLLAYSSIAHAGYVAVGVAAAPLGTSAVLFYLFVYGALTLGSFGVIALLDDDDPTIDGLAGLWSRRPLVVAALGVILFGLTGLPLTGGFLAKLYVFQAAMEAELLWLVILGLLASVVSAAYYLRILLACFHSGNGDASISAPPHSAVLVVCLAALAVLALGVLPAPLLDFVQAPFIR